jgi:drug/metabolite transporter (DMT)-like permease
VLLMAPLFLGESLTGRKIAVALIGFAGVLVVAQPGVQPLNWGHAAGMAAAIGFAINLIYTRKIMQHDQVLCVLFWMTASQCVMGLILALGLGDGFTWPNLTLSPWLAVVAIAGLTAHYSLTTALGLAPAMLVAPMEFARLPIIALVGVALYAEALDPWVFVGGAIIFAANLWNLRPMRTEVTR